MKNISQIIEKVKEIEREEESKVIFHSGFWTDIGNITESEMSTLSCSTTL